jgi:hypothetical protein
MEQKRLNVFEREFSSFFDWKISLTSPRYDLLGYDLTAFFLRQLNDSKAASGEWKSTLSYPEGIQSQFQFERKSNASGYINQRIYVSEYP